MKKIIFVDDSATVLMSVDMATQDLVANGTISIETYVNPEDVLKDIQNGKEFDLLITDINMPQMNGFDLCLKVREMAFAKSKPILALTTENTPDMKTQGKQSGINGWITKPFTNEKIVMAIKRVLRIR